MQALIHASTYERFTYMTDNDASGITVVLNCYKYAEPELRTTDIESLVLV